MNEFKLRRNKLMNKLVDRSAVLVRAADICPRNNDVEYSFRQNSDFYYLSGFEEPDALLLLLPGRKEGQFVLFNRPNDPIKEVWDGARAGQQGACEEFGADVAYSIDELDDRMPELLQDRECVYFTFKDQAGLSDKVFQWTGGAHSSSRRESFGAKELFDLDPILHEMRLFKSVSELALLQKAADISVAAHKRAMKAVQQKQFEYQLEAELLHEFFSRGARQQAYNSIVGGGKNSCILHYVQNNEPLKAGDLVLIDAGAEYRNYASDVTRTFPINGEFSAEQKIIYEIVLKAQVAVINHIKPGVRWDELQKIAIKIISQGLSKHGLIGGDTNNDVTQFYMHNIGHWMGLDVHDVGSYKVNGKWRKLEEGIVFTVEPGIYIAKSKSVDKKWWNIGVRIEDDVVVTKDGCSVLTSGVPKTVDEIEKLMAG